MKNDRLTQIFKALANPTRRAILVAITAGPLSVGELAQPFKMSEPAVIKHLGVLEKSGLVVIDRDRQIRRRVLNASPLEEAHQWIGTFSGHWEDSFNKLDDLLDNLQQQKKDKRHG